jgi:hypothetical protein
MLSGQVIGSFVKEVTVAQFQVLPQEFSGELLMSMETFSQDFRTGVY